MLTVLLDGSASTNAASVVYRANTAEAGTIIEKGGLATLSSDGRRRGGARKGGLTTFFSDTKMRDLS